MTVQRWGEMMAGDAFTPEEFDEWQDWFMRMPLEDARTALFRASDYKNLLCSIGEEAAA